MKTSAGILLFRNKTLLEVFLVHPGGPFWKNKDYGAWSIPKGEFSDNEDPLAAAKREFKEETGMECSGTFIPLTPCKQKNNKIVYAWALEMDINLQLIKSNTFEIEWPPRSGKRKSFPEIDKGGWFTPAEARLKMVPGQIGFVDELEALLSQK